MYVNINDQNIDIKIYFDKEKLYLRGWETKDIYNNPVLTEIKIQEVNRNISENIFDLQRFN